MSGDRAANRPRWLGEDRRVWDHIRVHIQLLDDTRIEAHELAVYLGLAKHAELESGRTFVAIATLTGYTGLSWHSVHRALKKLESAGYVTRETRKGRTSLFWLPKPPPLAHSYRCSPGASSQEREPVIADVQDTPSQDADEQDPLDKNQGTKEKPLPSPLARRERDDPLWLPLLAACGLQAATLTRSARGAANKALKELRDVDANPVDIQRRADVWHQRLPRAVLTPLALAKHWPQLADVGEVLADPFEEAGAFTA